MYRAFRQSDHFCVERTLEHASRQKVHYRCVLRPLLKRHRCFQYRHVSLVSFRVCPAAAPYHSRPSPIAQITKFAANMFYSQKMFWSARYPRRSPHPSRPHVGLDSVQYAPATMGTSKLRFSGSSSASMRQKYLRAASATGSGIRGRASNRPNQPRHQTREIGPSGGRAVRFDSVVQMILVPTRTDLSGLRADLWWKEEDYCTFRCVVGDCRLRCSGSSPIKSRRETL